MESRDSLANVCHPLSLCPSPSSLSLTLSLTLTLTLSLSLSVSSVGLLSLSLFLLAVLQNDADARPIATFAHEGGFSGSRFMVYRFGLGVLGLGDV